MEHPKKCQIPSCPDSVGRNSENDVQDGRLVRSAGDLIEKQKLRLKVSCRKILHHAKDELQGNVECFSKLDTIGLFEVPKASPNPGYYHNDYMNALCRLTKNYVERKGSGKEESALRHAVLLNKEPGSSTVCIGGIKDGILSGINIGETGMIVVRDEQILYRTKIKRDPATDDPFDLDSCSHNTFIYGDDFKLKMEPGDIIVMASKLVWDNVPCDAIRYRVQDIYEAYRRFPSIEPVNTAALYIAEQAIREVTNRRMYEKTGKALHPEIGIEGYEKNDVAAAVALVLSEEDRKKLKNDH